MPLEAKRIALLALVFFLGAQVAATAGEQLSPSARSGGDEDSFSPNRSLRFLVPRVDGTIRIDGTLDDDAWKGAARLDNFVEIDPGENVRPAVATETYLTYDDSNLYVGFVCYDDPQTIRATLTDRDNIFQDDFVGIMIDTFRDEQNAYEFFVNPYGIQGDLRRNRDVEDSSYDAVWSSNGRIAQSGWTAEIAIPFRSIRYPDSDRQDWGLHVIRVRPRTSREQISWAPISRDETCIFCVAGTMEGLEGINGGRNLELLPYALGSQSSSLDGGNDETFDWQREGASGQAGIGLKYGITSNYTLDATYNPDFSQIESDATQIDANQTFALFFPERRPFFLEGADIFATGINAVYTRTINDPLAAGKVTGKSGANTIGMVSALDRTSPYIVPFTERSEVTDGGESWTNIVRAKRDFLSDSFAGLLFTDRRSTETSGGANTTASADMRVRFMDNYSIEAHAAGSYTSEPDDTSLTSEWDDIRFGEQDQYTGAFDGESYAGHAIVAKGMRRGRHYNLDVFYEDYSPAFRAENGFIQRNNYRMAGFWNGYTLQVDNHPVLERVEPQLSAGRYFNYQGQRIDEWLEPSVYFRFRKQTQLWTSLLWSSERLSGVLVEGIRRWQGNMSTQFSSVLGGGIVWRYGHSLVRETDDPRLGNEFSVDTWVDFKPIPRLQASMYYVHFKLNEIDTGEEIDNAWVTRLRLTYQFTPRLYLRAIAEYVDWDSTVTLDPLLSYKINPFTVFFVGSSHAFHNFGNDPVTPGDEARYRETDRVFFVKIQYLLRV